jgi:hypothetical protein
MWRRSLPGYLNRSLIRLVYPFFFSLLLLPFFLTCTQSRRIYSELSDTEYTSVAYRSTLDRWTRKASIHKGLGTELLVTATYKAEEFRRAFAREYGRLYMQTPQENQKMIDDQVSAAKDYDDFIVAIYTPEREWDDFAERDSLWKVYLIRDGRLRLEPLEIRKVKKDRILSESFYPFISPWSTVYDFRFKKEDQYASRSLELILTSPSGLATLKWDF